MHEFKDCPHFLFLIWKQHASVIFWSQRSKQTPFKYGFKIPACIFLGEQILNETYCCRGDDPLSSKNLIPFSQNFIFFFFDNNGQYDDGNRMYSCPHIIANLIVSVVDNSHVQPQLIFEFVSCSHTTQNCLHLQLPISRSIGATFISFGMTPNTLILQRSNIPLRSSRCFLVSLMSVQTNQL